MPAAPGESVVTTLFADVHYYLSDPTTPTHPHHRFAKGSYLYLYYSAHNQLARIEIANHAGTPDQDATSGSLQGTRISYSHKQPTLFTVTVDHTSASPQQGHSQKQWHLPCYDQRNEKKYMYPLHTLDIYLWTEQDAASLLSSLKAMMPSERFDIKDAPPHQSKTIGLSAASASPAEHRDSMSPVVQQLEKTAIGAQFPPRAESAYSDHRHSSSGGFPGPPASVSNGVQGATVGAVSSPPPQRQPAPMAYNPAAPAAPEPIAYREKTPPPPDDGTGTGLTAAAKYDAVPQFASVPQGHYAQNSNQSTPQGAYFSGPPQQQQQTPSFPTTFAGPPQSAPPPIQRSYSGGLPPPPGPPGASPSPHNAVSPPPAQPPQQRQPSFGPHAVPTTNTLPTQQFASYPTQQQQQFATYPAQSPGFSQFQHPQQQQQQQPPTPSAPPAYAGHTPLSSPGLPPPPPSQPPQQAAAMGMGMGYSNYTYSAAQPSQAQALNQHGAYVGDVHSQVYRPSEAEANSHGGHGAHGAHGHGASGSSGGTGTGTGTGTGIGRQRLEERVGSAEKKVGGWMKRLDKLI